MIQNLFRIIGEFLFPSSCLGCGKKETRLCSKCLSSIWPAEELPPDTIAVFSYQHPVAKKALRRFKFSGEIGLAEIFTRALKDHLLEELADSEIFDGKSEWLIVPVPMTWKRKLSRGGNQTEVLAKQLGKLIGIPVAARAIAKIRETKPQSEINNRKERLQNIKGGFIAEKPDLLRGKNLILLDDIITTGATLNELAKVARAAGTKKIIKCAVAH